MFLGSSRAVLSAMGWVLRTNRVSMEKQNAMLAVLSALLRDFCPPRATVLGLEMANHEFGGAAVTRRLERAGLLA
eukprot:2959849-Alexandrium_andersonii.AAC.1